MIILQRELHMSVLKRALVKVYQRFEDIQKGEEIFQCTLNNKLLKKIFFLGCSIYILISILMKQKENDENNDELIPEFKKIDNIFNDFSNLTKSLIGISFDYFKKLNKFLMKRPETKEIIIKIEESHILHKTLLFFRINTAHIEIVKNKKTFKIYFPKLPLCKSLPEEIKQLFLDQVNRTNNKTKLIELMTQSDKMLRIMKNEESLNNFINNYRFISMITVYSRFWSRISFYTTIVINFIIMASYSNESIPRNTQIALSDQNDLRLNHPYLFGNQVFDKTVDVLFVLGSLNLVFAFFIFINFLLKKVPLLINDIWFEYYTLKNRFLKILSFVLKTFYSVYICICDVEFVYHLIYIVTIICGLTVHPFFFACNLSEFFIKSSIESVLEATWRPRKFIIILFMVFCVGEYYFALLASNFFYDMINGCDEFLIICWLEIFDQTFKV